MGSQEGSQDHQLHALLDDALEAFDQAPRRVAAPAAASGAAGSSAAAPPAAAAGAAAAAAPEPSSAAAPAAGGTGAPRGLAFDPLSRQPARRAAGRAGAAAASGAGQQAPREADELDVLSQGLSKLLEELAKADEEDVGAGGEPATAAAAAAAGGAGQPPSQQQQQQQWQQGERRPQRDLHATLQALSEQAPSFAGAPDSEEAMLRLLAEQLGGLGGLGGGGGGGAAGGGAGDAAAPPEMAGLVDALMQQLISKEVLYQPMKDIGAKYPEWLAANRERLSPEDYSRYEQQHAYIQRICAVYESSPSDFGQLVDLLQQMQQCGQPPQEIVDELAPGLQFGSDGLPAFGGEGGEQGLPPELRDCCIM